MRVRRGGRVVTLLRPVCMALALGSCAHLPGWVPFARPEPDAVQRDATGAAARGNAAPLALAASGITGEAVTHRVDALASSRPIGYIAAELSALGLEPAGDSGAFVQRLPIDRAAAPRVTAGDPGSGDDSDGRVAPTSVQPAAAVGPAAVSLHASGAQGASSPVFGRDFFVQSMSASSVSAPLVWAGVAAPGRRAPGPEAAGRVLAFYLPGDAPDKAWRAALSNAVQGSVTAGAAAVLLVLDPELDEETVAMLASRPSDDAAQAPVVGLRYAAAQTIFRNGLRNLDQLRNGPNRLVPVTGTTITLDVAAAGEITDDRPSNIVAILPGSDPVLKDTYVVFSAPIATELQPARVATRPGDAPPRYAETHEAAALTPAAATLIEVAAAFAALPAPPARSLIFLGAGGAGAGRIGSQYFTANPPVLAARIVASISIESVIENATDTIAAVGQHYTSMGPLVERVARTHPELNLTVAPDLSPEDDRFLTGDSFSFARIGVPAISFTAAPPRDTSDTGNVNQADYTIEADDAGRLARIAQFIFYFGHTLASRAERPIWTAEGRAAVQKNE